MSREFELVLYQHGRRSYGIEENVKRAVKKLGELRIDSQGIAVFPEMWFGPIALEEDKLNEALTPLHLLSSDLGLHILPGAFYISTGEGAFSRSYMIFPDGRMELMSEKIFPSLPVREREKIRAGRILKTVDLGFVKVGAVICVDAMYPEIARCLALRGAELILNPASIPENRASLWRSLASVRAAENTVFWAAVMLTESTYPDGRPVRGGSVAADPKGEIIADSGALEQAIRVKIDLSVLERQRERWPYLSDISSSSLSGICGILMR